MRPALLVLLSAVLLSACSQEIETGPAEVRWDRETCVRCAMSVGDNRYAAQVREDVEPFRTHVFDDIGCAVIWLEQQSGVDTAGFEIWVNDHRNSHWVDARQAWYVEGNQSPMGYNLSAQREPSDGALDFDAAMQHIRQVESDRKLHADGHAGHVKTIEP